MATRPAPDGRMTDDEGRLLPNAYAENTLVHRCCTSDDGDCREQNKYGFGVRVAACGRALRNQDLARYPSKGGVGVWGKVGVKCPDCLRICAEGFTCPDCGHVHQPREGL